MHTKFVEITNKMKGWVLKCLTFIKPLVLNVVFVHVQTKVNAFLLKQWPWFGEWYETFLPFSSFPMCVF
jgi:hypothetical protein